MTEPNYEQRVLGQIRAMQKAIDDALATGVRLAEQARTACACDDITDAENYLLRAEHSLNIAKTLARTVQRHLESIEEDG